MATQAGAQPQRQASVDTVTFAKQAGKMKVATNKAAIRLHDRVNLCALPLIGVLSVAGLLGYYDASKVTNMMLSYIVADLVWVWVEPGCLPRTQKA
ncbi:hypothetical protein WJX79_003614 [Trebouxia sp. C0005]